VTATETAEGVVNATSGPSSSYTGRRGRAACPALAKTMRRRQRWGCAAMERSDQFARRDSRTASEAAPKRSRLCPLQVEPMPNEFRLQVLLDGDGDNTDLLLNWR